MAINLKNYTTTVAASRSIDAIEKLLIQFGARNIMKEYSDLGRCISIQFIIEVEKDLKLPFKLSPKINECLIWLKKRKKNSNQKLLFEQAERIVWKQLYEFTYLQLCQVELDQLEKLEAFFPFLYDFKKGLNYYQQMKQRQFQGLLPEAN